MTLNEYFNKEEIELHPCGKEYLVKRQDDNYKTVISRYDTYMSTTKPVLDFYSNKTNFSEIDGAAEIDEITSKINQLLMNDEITLKKWNEAKLEYEREVLLQSPPHLVCEPLSPIKYSL